MKQGRLFGYDRKERIKAIGKWIATGFKVWFAIVSLFSFGLFIFEESGQVTMFGIWAAQDAKDWILVKKGIDKIENINRIMRTINHAIGWIHPIGYLSYKSYAEGTDSYIASSRSKCFAHAPELFENERIRFSFAPQSVRQIDGKYHYQGRNLTVITARKLLLGQLAEINGVVVNDNGILVIE